MLADDFGRGILLDALGAAVPARHAPLEIEHIDRVVGHAFDQQTIAAHRLGRARAPGQVANDPYREAGAVGPGPADRAFNGKGRTILAPPDSGGAVDAAVEPGRIGCRHQHGDASTDHLGGAVAEQPFTGRIDQPHRLGRIDHDDSVGRALDDGTQQTCIRVFARLDLKSFGQWASTMLSAFDCECASICTNLIQRSGGQFGRGCCRAPNRSCSDWKKRFPLSARQRAWRPAVHIRNPDAVLMLPNIG